MEQLQLFHAGELKNDRNLHGSFWKDPGKFDIGGWESIWAKPPSCSAQRKGTRRRKSSELGPIHQYLLDMLEKFLPIVKFKSEIYDLFHLSLYYIKYDFFLGR